MKRGDYDMFYSGRIDNANSSRNIVYHRRYGLGDILRAGSRSIAKAC